MDEQQSLGVPYSFEWNGSVIRFSGITQKVKAACVAAAKLNAIMEAKENAELRWPDADPASVQAKSAYMQRVEDDMTTGRYKWGGELQEQWRKGPDGIATMALAMLEGGGNPMTRDDLEAIARDKPEEFGAVIVLATWDCNNPKAKRPATVEALAAKINPKPQQTPLPSTLPSSLNPTGSRLMKSAG